MARPPALQRKKALDYPQEIRPGARLPPQGRKLSTSPGPHREIRPQGLPLSEEGPGHRHATLRLRRGPRDSGAPLEGLRGPGGRPGGTEGAVRPHGGPLQENQDWEGGKAYNTVADGKAS